MQKSIKDSMPSEFKFYNFRWFLERKGRMLAPNRMKNRCQVQKADFAKSNEKQMIVQVFGFEVGIDFWSDLGANMPSFSLQKHTKNALKLELGRHQFFDGFLHRFFIDFPSIWEANLGLCWPLRRAQDASKTAPKTKRVTFFAPAVILLDVW